MNTLLISVTALSAVWAILATRANNRLIKGRNQAAHKMRLAQKRAEVLKTQFGELTVTGFSIEHNDVSCSVIGLCHVADGSTSRIRIKRYAHEDAELNLLLAEETLDNLTEHL